MAISVIRPCRWLPVMPVAVSVQATRPPAWPRRPTLIPAAAKEGKKDRRGCLRARRRRQPVPRAYVMRDARDARRRVVD